MCFFCATSGRVADRASLISARSPSGGIEEWAKGSARVRRVRLDLGHNPTFLVILPLPSIAERRSKRSAVVRLASAPLLDVDDEPLSP